MINRKRLLLIKSLLMKWSMEFIPWQQKASKEGDIPIDFFNCYLAVPRPTLDHSQGDNLPNPMLITAFVHVWPESHREPRNEVGSLSLPEHLAGFELGTFRFWLQRLNPLGHSPQKMPYKMPLIPIYQSQQRLSTPPLNWMNFQIIWNWLMFFLSSWKRPFS